MTSQARDEAERPIHVLFLCTGNSARSLLAEALLSRLGGGRFRSFSAGSQPKDRPHRRTIEILDRLGFETKELRSKSWNEFARPDSPPLDFIFTVCGNAADETCPVWPGHPVSAHWGVDDPAAFSGSPTEERAFFERVHGELAEKVRRFIALDLSSSDDPSLALRLSEIGRA